MWFWMITSDLKHMWVESFLLIVCTYIWVESLRLIILYMSWIIFADDICIYMSWIISAEYTCIWIESFLVIMSIYELNNFCWLYLYISWIISANNTYMSWIISANNVCELYLFSMDIWKLKKTLESLDFLLILFYFS